MLLFYYVCVAIKPDGVKKDEKIFIKRFIFFSVTCGEIFVASNHVQSFSTPNWPETYPDNQDCHWIIRSDGINEFDVMLNQGETQPDFDYVEVSL